jgi:hypothetical protein
VNQLSLPTESVLSACFYDARRLCRKVRGEVLDGRSLLDHFQKYIRCLPRNLLYDEDDEDINIFASFVEDGAESNNEKDDAAKRANEAGGSSHGSQLHCLASNAR